MITQMIILDYSYVHVNYYSYMVAVRYKRQKL